MKSGILVLILVCCLDSARANHKNCSNAQSLELQRIEKNILLRLLELERQWPSLALSEVHRSFVIPKQRQWVPSGQRHAVYITYWRVMGDSLRKMLEVANEGINFQCHTQQSGRCREGVEAYVLFYFNRPQKRIHLCPSFNQRELKAKTQTVFHELSHLAANSEDLALSWWQKEGSNLQQAAQDAYHLESFMYGDLIAIHQRLIWNWWWPAR
jgi:hypothetical protein